MDEEEASQKKDSEDSKGELDEEDGEELEKSSEAHMGLVLAKAKQSGQKKKLEEMLFKKEVKEESSGPEERKGSRRDMVGLEEEFSDSSLSEERSVRGSNFYENKAGLNDSGDFYSSGSGEESPMYKSGHVDLGGISQGDFYEERRSINPGGGVQATNSQRGRGREFGRDISGGRVIRLGDMVAGEVFAPEGEKDGFMKMNPKKDYESKG